MEHYYQVLNLAPNAGASEIKQAYRRLAKQFHPDSARLGAGDAARFQEVYEAYQALMGNLPGYKRDFQAPAASYTGFRPPETDEWQFKGIYHEGLNVIYVIEVSLAAAQPGLRLYLPWKKEETCPRCLGLGHSYETQPQAQCFTRVACARCETQGVISHNTIIEVNVPADAMERGEYRLRGRGHYDPFTAVRGDLIVKFETDSCCPGWKARSYNA
ncbi:MAG: J domain-containing protein [Deltaproteobacteria bacterium]|nr:J domain-containing protein [Deltaproteobacteria bacterium]MBW2084495.1 J domain-containing protein [Deltaproteobacteria bacterium]